MEGKTRHRGLLRHRPELAAQFTFGAQQRNIVLCLGNGSVMVTGSADVISERLT